MPSCVFEEDTPLALIEALKPDILVKGADYTVDTVVGADVVQKAGGRVVLGRYRRRKKHHQHDRAACRDNRRQGRT